MRRKTMQSLRYAKAWIRNKNGASHAAFFPGPSSISRWTLKTSIPLPLQKTLKCTALFSSALEKNSMAHCSFLTNFLIYLILVLIKLNFN